MSHPTFLNRQALHLRPDPARVVVRPFRPATEPRELNPLDRTRADHILERVLALGPADVSNELAEVLENFEGRHRNLLDKFAARAHEMGAVFADRSSYTLAQQQLVGAYFLHEYSFEAAALFNPSIVAHPDQTGAPKGDLRFILSLRAVGEGHVSSLTFRSGTLRANGSVLVDATARLASIPMVMEQLAGEGGETITFAFEPESELSERVIFPITPQQSNGIEDARFVQMEESGERIYRATYTAYSGLTIRSEMIETTDFLSFRMAPLRGPAARNKGMALFPRRIGGRYAMVGRHDNENLHIIYSDDLCHWDEGETFLEPKWPWEFVQIGNCGSPIELDEGWLLLTHGVGPVRRYSIGGVLLDKDDPSRVIARSREPLVRPDASEREGYVPNVVYTCGAIRHNGRIVLPYAVSDTFSTFATIKIAALLNAMDG